MSDKLTSFISLIELSAQKYENRQAMVIRRKIRKETISFSELKELLPKLEKYFREKGIKTKSKVLIWGLNCPEYAYLLLGCFSLNRTAVSLDYRTTSSTILSIIDKTGPKAAFVSRYLRNDFLLDRKIKVFYIEDLFSNLKKIKKQLSFKKISQNKEFRNGNNLSEIVFTSGTTGIPKGVMIRQKNLLANLSMTAGCLPAFSKPRILSLLPLSHMFEQMIGLLFILSQGGTVYYLVRQNSFRVLQAFREYKPTHQIFVPQLLKILWERVESGASEKSKLPTLKKMMHLSAFLPFFARRIIFREIHQIFGGKLMFVGCGGAPMDPVIAKNWEAIGIPVYEGYGATEVTAVATFNRLGKNQIGSAGQSVPGVKISFDDEGQIFISSEAISDGYYKDPQKTKESFGKAGFKTGDIGFSDNNGYLHIVGRDAFKIVLPSGEKVYAEDLEMKIKKDPRVREVCIVARKEEAGDKIHAFFILKENKELKKIVRDLNANLESKEQITSFALWSENDFPRTNTLKIDRKVMVEIANEKIDQHGKQSRTGPIQTNYFDILDVVSKVSGFAREKLSDGDILTSDLSMDSLSRSELVALCEEYLGIIIDESKINSQTTVGDLKKLAAGSEKVEEILLPVWQFTWWGRIIHKIAVGLLLLPSHRFLIKINFPQKKVPRILPGSIVIFNHPGILDEICAFRLIYSQGLTDFVTNAASYLWIPEVTTIAKLNEIFACSIPLYESGKKFIKVMQTDSDLLDKGYILFFAPQGTTQRSDAEDPFKPGIGYIVQELDRPVTIIRIKDYRAIWPAPKEDVKYAKFKDLLPKRRGTAKVVVSKPYHPDWSSMSYIQITNLLEEKYREL